MKKQMSILQPHIGDIVQLMGLGPPLFVETEPAEGWTPCVWWDAEDVLHRDKFRTSMLTEYEGGARGHF